MNRWVDRSDTAPPVYDDTDAVDRDIDPGYWRRDEHTKGPVLCIDTVAFSQLPYGDRTQRAVVQALESEVSMFFRHVMWPRDDPYVYVPTGDGFLLAFPAIWGHGKSCWVATALVIHLYKYMAEWKWRRCPRKVLVRAGLAFGGYARVLDGAGNANMDGPAVIAARRVADFSGQGCHFVVEKLALANMADLCAVPQGGVPSYTGHVPDPAHTFSAAHDLLRVCEEYEIPHNICGLDGGQELVATRLVRQDASMRQPHDKHNEKYHIFNVFARYDVGQETAPEGMEYDDVRRGDTFEELPDGNGSERVGETSA